MKFGLTGCFGGFDDLSLEARLTLVEEAEALGYESFWLNEEHFQGPGRLCLSPVVLASFVAARTSRLRLGFSVLLLPLHDPLRLAEDIASLDVLSNGRVDFGISRGGNDGYHRAFGVDAETRTQRYVEALECILGLWTSDAPFTFRGEHFCYQDIQLSPRPVQQPHPPVYVAARSAESVMRAATDGHRFQAGPVQAIPYAIQDAQLFRTAALRSGRQPGPDDVTFARFVFVAETDAQAEAESAPIIAAQVRRFRGFGIHQRENTIDDDQLTPDYFGRDVVIRGSPLTCVRRIQELQSAIGFGRFSCRFSFPGSSTPEQVRRSIRLFAREVMPAFESANAEGGGQ